MHFRKGPTRWLVVCFHVLLEGLSALLERGSFSRLHFASLLLSSGTCKYSDLEKVFNKI